MTLNLLLLIAAFLPTPQPRGLPVRVEALVASVDSFVMRVQGNDVGSQVYRTEPTADGFVLSEKTVTPAGGQETRVVLDRAARVVSVDQTGMSRGAAMAIRVSYANGRVTGSSMTPPATTPTAIDMVVPADVVDDNALFSLLPALPWKADASWTFTMFSAGQASASERTLKVTGTETVSVPAGTFETYRASMTADGRTVNFFVATAAPHRVMKITIDGVPMEFVRAR